MSDHRSRVTALCIVGRTSVDFEVMMQWIAMLRKVYWPGPLFMIPEIYANGGWIGVVALRNLATYYALRDDSWDELLFIDADHMVTAALVERLAEHGGRYPILGGFYCGRAYPFEVQAFESVETSGVRYIDPRRLVPLLDPPSSAVIEVAGVGTGCMLIQREVLERMRVIRGEGEIFRAGRLEWSAQRALIERGEQPSGVWTEDIMFCLDAKELLGTQTYLDLDPRMDSGHVGREPRGRRHYLAAHVVPPHTNVDTEQLRRMGYEMVPHKLGKSGRRQRR